MDVDEAAERTLRQFVHFSFHQVDPAWRRLPEEERQRGRKELGNLLEAFRERCILRTYTLQGLRGDADFVLWKISERLEDFTDLAAAMAHTPLGGYLSTPHAFLSMTKRSTYVDKHVHPGQEGRRDRIMPGEHQYLFVYPFVKTRAWYTLSKEERQGIMDEHIAVGHRYPSVKLNTTYSYGLDDQEFVLAFETDNPQDFLDLVMELRETRVSQYTLRDTPIFTCVAKPLWDLLEEVA